MPTPAQHADADRPLMPGGPVDLLAQPAGPASAADDGHGGVEAALALTADLASAGSPEDISTALLQRAVETADADIGVLCRIERGEVIAGPVWREGRIHPSSSRATLAELPALAAVAAGGRHHQQQGRAGLLPGGAAERVADVAWVAAVPILVGAELDVTAVVVVARRRAQAFTDDELESVRLMGSLGAATLRAQRLRAAADNASRTKGEFLALVAHEMRSPVGVISGYVAMLRDGALGAVPDRWQRPLATMEAKVGEINTIIEDLLSAARLQSGSLSPNPRQIDLRALVLDAIARAQPRADLVGASLDALVPETSVTVDVDGRQVLRVLDNLINNAFNYSEGRPWVEVALTATAESAEIRVSDHGVGIPTRMRKRIFERFGRGGRSTRARPGTGLGLAIAREMAELNGGRLLLDHSVVGKGSRFLLRLPLAMA
jgi:signal transduction histidine kinase